MFKRMRYQQGCLIREKRKTSPDVWVFRWRESSPDGQKRNRKALVGTVERYPTESRATKAAEGLRLEINQEAPRAVISSMTLGQLISHYQDKELPKDSSQAKVPKAHSTMVTYRRYLQKWIMPRWDSYRLQDVRPVVVEDWLHALKAANGTKAKVRNIMSAIFRHAIRYGFLPRHEESNPIKYVRQSAGSDVVPIIFTKEQIWKIIGYLQEPARTMAFLDAFTGLRISELLGLKWSDIDFERSEVNVRRAIVYGVVGNCKSKASKRPVALDPVLADTLRHWRLKTPYNKPEDWVFASTRLSGRKPLNPGMIRKRHLQPAARKAGVIGNIGWHTFRRTLATLFIADGVDVKTVQESLRHSTSRITLDLYAQATMPGKLLAQRNLIDTIVPKSQQPAVQATVN